MKIAYFDCFAGASGDMILGALLDAGLELSTLKAELARLGLSGYALGVRKVRKQGIGGSQALVEIHGMENAAENHDHPPPESNGPPHHHEHGHHPLPDHHQAHHIHHDHHHDHEHHHHDHRHQHSHPAAHPHRNLHDIRNIITASSLTDAVKAQSIRIFERLAEAEARVHQSTVEEVHFHEVGALDAIIDVVGGVVGLAAMGIEAVYCSPLHVGCGTVTCAHGTLPVPAPATLELIRGKPVYSTGVRGELLTPTGAAILTTLAVDFGPLPAMTVQHIGYGAGQKELPISNLLRLSIGTLENAKPRYQTERVAVLQTTIDDMNPQVYDYLMERLLDMGAKDVFYAPVQMKKNRMGTLVTVLCPVDMVNPVADLLLRETTSIGLRWHIEERLITHRQIRQVQTPLGVIRYKVARNSDGQTVNISPEYDDCKLAAHTRGVPLKQVLERALAAAVVQEQKESCPR